jgi:hypothetical protein
LRRGNIIITTRYYLQDKIGTGNQKIIHMEALEFIIEDNGGCVTQLFKYF